MTESKIFNVPITLLSQVNLGFVYDKPTKAWAAKWKIKSGLKEIIFFSSFFLSLMSNLTSLISYSSWGSVAWSHPYPLTPYY